jgi:hypothetical protein
LSHKIVSYVPDKIFEVLDHQRGNFSMSSYVMNLLASYVDVVENEEICT